jgi:hypothetical protein
LGIRIRSFPGFSFQGQPTVFNTGTYERAFAAAWNPTAFKGLSWDFNGLTAIADSTTPLCVAGITGTASDVTLSTATLRGDVDIGGQGTTYHFEYGNGSGDVSTPTRTALPGPQETVSEPIGDLGPGNPYHFRLVATNSDGTTQGTLATFTTLAPPPPPTTVTATTTVTTSTTITAPATTTTVTTPGPTTTVTTPGPTTSVTTPGQTTTVTIAGPTTTVTVPGPTTTVTTPARTTTVSHRDRNGPHRRRHVEADAHNRRGLRPHMSAGARRCTLRVVAGVAVTTSRSAHVDVVASAPSTIAEDSAHTDAGRPVAFVLCLNARGRQLVRALGQRFQSLAATLTIHAESGAQSASATVPAIFRRP